MRVLLIARPTTTYINESLTAYRKRLLGKVNAFNKTNEWKYPWTTNEWCYPSTTNGFVTNIPLRYYGGL